MILCLLILMKYSSIFSWQQMLWMRAYPFFAKPLKDNEARTWLRLRLWVWLGFLNSIELTIASLCKCFLQKADRRFTLQRVSGKQVWVSIFLFSVGSGRYGSGGKSCRLAVGGLPVRSHPGRVEVSLSKTPNPQLLLTSWLVPCMAANRRWCVNVCVKGWMRGIYWTALWIKALYEHTGSSRCIQRQRGDKGTSRECCGVYTLAGEETACEGRTEWVREPRSGTGCPWCSLGWIQRQFLGHP